jgi:capsular polysaccharide biosynthesis protein
VLYTHAGVVVGIHGAALTNQIWMRPHRGAVVEFGQGSNLHYHNMAAMLGHRYLEAEGTAQSLSAALTAAMDYVASRY